MADKKKHPEIEIRIAGPEDREIVAALFLKLINYLDPFGHDMLPTRKNATYMTDTLLMPAAERGEPVLIAWAGDKPIGAVFWVIQRPPYECRWSFAVGYGTFIEEGYRSKRIGTRLRRRGFEILKEKGVEKLLASVLLKNTLSVENCDRTGAKPLARIDLFDVT